ncbi:hypothetical protein ACMBCM_06055 [Spiroplasma sp. K1]
MILDKIVFYFILLKDKIVNKLITIVWICISCIYIYIYIYIYHNFYFWQI